MRGGPVAALRAWGLALVLASSLYPITSFDIFWHIRVARDMLTSGTFPDGDIYSFSRPGGMYVEDEWFSQVSAYLLHEAFGFNGLIVLKWLLMTGAAAVLYLECRARTGSEALGAGLAALATVAARSRLLVRPDGLNVVLTPLLFVLVSAYRRTGRRRFLWLLPLLLGFWANCHTGATLALILLAAMALVAAAAPILARLLPRASWHAAGGPAPLLLTTIVSVPAVLVNPIGFKFLTFPFDAVRIHRTIEWRPTPLALFPLFALLAAIFLAGLLLSLLRTDPAIQAGGLLLLYLGVTHVRMMGICAVGLAVPTAISLASAGKMIGLRRLSDRLKTDGATWLVTALLLSGSLYFVFANRYHAFGLGLARDTFPEAAADFVLRERLPPNVWNEFTLGGYLIYRLYPTYKVFIDGREEPYYDLLDEIRAALRSPQAFSSHLERYGISFGLVRLSREPFWVAGPDGKTVARGWSYFFSPQDYALVYWDDVAMIFVRRRAVAADWLRRHEIRNLKPDDFRLQLVLASRDPALRRRLLDDIEAKLRQDPSCDFARFLLGLFRRLPRPAGPTLVS